MTCINSSEFFTTLDFSDFVEEIYDVIRSIYDKTIRRNFRKRFKGGESKF